MVLRFPYRQTGAKVRPLRVSKLSTVTPVTVESLETVAEKNSLWSCSNGGQHAASSL